MPDISFHELGRLDSAAYARLLQRSELDLSGYMAKAAPILEAVQREGDAALARFGREFDGAAGLSPDGLRVTEAEFDAAFGAVEAEVVEAIRFAIANITAFHREQAPGPMWLREMRSGAYAGDRFTPIRSVALYVPRGKGAFPSVTMMTAVPAVVAGVPDLAILTPPAPDGSVDAATLVAARLAGVEVVCKAGGAQAVAAAAYGTETVAKARKIVGPGSPWVVAAKRALAGVIDPGLPAGPSEAIILADETVDGGLAALDLLVEAEHGPDSSAYLVTPSRRVAEAALSALPQHLAEMTEARRGFAQAVLGGPNGGIVLAPSTAAAYDFVNAYAPEHLEILSDDPFAHLGHITEAAEILLGPRTPVTLANFCLGPNAVLPTSGGARTYGPLSVTDFMKRSSVGYVTPPAYADFAARAATLARYEGFSSHANAVSAMRERYLKPE